MWLLSACHPPEMLPFCKPTQLNPMQDVLQHLRTVTTKQSLQAIILMGDDAQW